MYIDKCVVSLYAVRPPMVSCPNPTWPKAHAYWSTLQKKGLHSRSSGAGAAGRTADG